MTDPAKLPPIVISEEDLYRLEYLAQAASTPPDVAAYLQRELDRAHVGTGDGVRHIHMNDFVAFRDTITGQDRLVQLVYPADSDPAQNKVSVLTPIGAALIGLAEGQTISWQTRGHGEHALTVLRVRVPACA